MQRQRWRWLWIWVGVLVAGCGQIWSSDGTPPPTREALPLFGYTLLPPSLTPGSWPVHTATPLITVDKTGTPVALYLTVSGPACYETAVGSLVCMGQVHNTYNQPVGQITVRVQLLTREGIPLDEEEAQVSRWLIPTTMSGPYRVVFDRVPPGYAGAYGYVTDAQPAAEVDEQYAAITVRRIANTFVLDQYQATLSIINQSRRPVEQLAITMTLLDSRGRVTGFRRINLPPDRRLEPGESLAMTLRVIPQGGNTVTFDAFAEGRFSLN